MAAAEEGLSTADQVARFASHKANNVARALDIDSVYDGAFLKNTRVLVTGANRGIGLALVHELIAKKANVVATCRTSSPELTAAAATAGAHVQIIEKCDVTSEKSCAAMAAAVHGGVLDIVINNAGTKHVMPPHPH